MNTRNLILIALFTIVPAAKSFAALDSVLNGMYVNVTAPDYTTSQFRGTISGGSIYMRAPTSSVQLFSMDPPRISAGCGGIDLYGGSLSFVSDAKMTQFLRDVAQNVPPLLFQMAVAQMFPQLDGMIKKFQSIAQDMNNQQIDSCKMASGIIDAARNPEAAMADMMAGINGTIAKAEGWANALTEAVTLGMTKPSEITRKAKALVDANGRPIYKQYGNIAWNVIKGRTDGGALLDIADSEDRAAEILMSLIGTEVRTEAASDANPSKVLPFGPPLKLMNLVNPIPDKAGVVGFPILSCNAGYAKCDPVKAPDNLPSYGIKGYINKNMLGSYTAVTPIAGSIVYQITHCTSSNCGLTAAQIKFLNSISKVPVVALLTRAQRNPAVLDLITPRLMDEMVDEVALLYSKSIVRLIVSLFSDTSAPKPESYNAAMLSMYQELRDLEAKTAIGLERLNADMVFIDNTNRSLAGGLGYRIK